MRRWPTRARSANTTPNTRGSTTCVYAAHPGLGWIDRWMARTFRFLDRRSDEFGVAFAAGAETVAYAGARWTDDRIGTLFDDAEPAAARLYLWHLAEEVEHKGAAHDVWEAFSGNRLKYVLGTFTSIAILAFFAFIGTLGLLWTQRRLFSPRAHWNLLVWSITYAFEFLTLAVISALPGHHPNDLADPVFLTHVVADTGGRRALNPPTVGRSGRGALAQLEGRSDRW